MSEERLDYAILISLAMREEAEVMASALRAEGIDAFVGNRHHTNVDWGWIIALGGMQVFVPRQKIDEAKDVIRARIKDAAAHPEGEMVERRDRWKAWVMILGTLGLNAYVYWLANLELPEISYAPTEIQANLPTYFVAPDNLTEAGQRAVLRDYCRDNPTLSVISREDGMGYVTQCIDVLRVN